MTCRPIHLLLTALPRFALLALAVAGLSGCARVRVTQQQLVSKPGMEFSRSAVFSYSSKTMSQVLPGLPGMPGASVTTCTACR